MISSKKYCHILITGAFSLCCLLPFSPLLAQTDSIANERIPVKAKQLEKHWNVDCAGIVNKTERFLAGNSDKTDETTALQRDIEKCIYIYNTPNSAHYNANPDYKHLLEKIIKVPD